ncbi:MAG: hypothetical protein K1X90_07720 [Candidatus Kapabacteria bacterium]|nr:hypothetical protein [Candidatus Kapabacteria bacterium]
MSNSRAAAASVTGPLASHALLTTDCTKQGTRTSPRSNAPEGSLRFFVLSPAANPKGLAIERISIPRLA